MEGLAIRWQRRGYLLFGAAAALLLVGLWRVDGVMAAMGLAGWGWLGVARVVAVRHLGGLQVELLAPAQAERGEKVRMGVRLLHRGGWGDAFRVTAEWQVPGYEAAVVRAPWIRSGEEAEGEMKVEAVQRGEGRRAWVRLHSDFPFGCFRAERELKVEGRWRVVPRSKVPVTGEWCGRRASDGWRVWAALAGGMGEWRGVRSFRKGDPLKAVVWGASVRAWGRGEGLVAAEMEPPGWEVDEVAVLFHSVGGPRVLVRPERFEHALALLHGLVRSLYAKKIGVRWAADFEGWRWQTVERAGDWDGFWQRLVAAKRCGTTEWHEVETMLEKTEGKPLVILFSDMPLEEWGSRVGKREGVAMVDVKAYERRPAGRR